MKDFTITHIGDTALSLPMPFKFILAKGKTFMFQTDDGSNIGTKSEGTPITFENDFWMCAYQTTQEFWAEVVKGSYLIDFDPNPSFYKGKTRPVEQVSWDDIQIFNEELNNLFKNGGLIVSERSVISGQFSLPAETQWEYAANANQNLVFAGSQNINDVAWYTENNNDQTMPVGLKQSNAICLYDMSGNVWEWCEDDFSSDSNIYPKNGNPLIDTYQTKSLRGGCCYSPSSACRLRNKEANDSRFKGSGVGFRMSFFPLE